MAADARADLNERLKALLGSERERYREITAPLHAGTDAAELHALSTEARTQTSARFPETMPAAAAVPAVTEAPTPETDAETDSKLRGLLDQLRGTFTRPAPEGDANGTAER